jgi:hypothetical protein
MFIIGTKGRSGLRVTSMEILETVEHLYYWLLIWRRQFLGENNWSRQLSFYQQLQELDFEEFLQDTRIKWRLPEIYYLDANLNPTYPKPERTTTKVNPTHLIEVFRQHNLDTRVLFNTIINIPDGLFINPTTLEHT